MAIINCSNCSEKVASGASFCYGCGAELHPVREVDSLEMPVGLSKPSDFPVEARSGKQLESLDCKFNVALSTYKGFKYQKEDDIASRIWFQTHGISVAVNDELFTILSCQIQDVSLLHLNCKVKLSRGESALKGSAIGLLGSGLAGAIIFGVAGAIGGALFNKRKVNTYVLRIAYWNFDSDAQEVLFLSIEKCKTDFKLISLWQYFIESNLLEDEQRYAYEGKKWGVRNF